MAKEKSKATHAAEIRAKLNHPIVDGDGHVIETRLVLLDYVKQIGGADMVKKFETMIPRWQYVEQRPIHWGMPSGPSSIDRATSMLPRLFRERMDDAGIDVAIMYSTLALGMMHIREDEIRHVGHRALNSMLAEMFRNVGDRLIPSAVIPMFTPAEALSEMDYAIGELGFKAATFGSEIRLPVQKIVEDVPELAPWTERITPVALDALHDYDQVWQKCVDLKLPVAFHTGARSGHDRHSSPTNFVFNHLGSFSTSGNYACRCIFLDGVTRRFPGLNFAFLEGGVSWGAQLYNDLFEHWEKRNLDHMQEYLDPAKLDMNLLNEMAEKYGEGIVTPAAMKVHAETDIMGGRVAGEIELDDFKRCEIKEMRDIVDLFIEPFYFGCEADDAMNAIAFDTRLNHYGQKLKAFFGSDIGHWDVSDMTHCVPQAYVNVEKGLFSEEDFRDFMFTNPVSFFTRQNPDFFNDSVIEDAAKNVALQ